MPQIRSIVLLFTDIKNASKPAKTKHYISIQSKIMSTQVFDMRLLAWIWDDLHWLLSSSNSYPSGGRFFTVWPPIASPYASSSFRKLPSTCADCFARALYIPWISSKALWRPYEMWETEARTSLRRGRKRDLRNCSFSATESSQCKLHFLLPSH